MSSEYENIATGLKEAVKDAERRKADVQEERIEQKAIAGYWGIAGREGRDVTKNALGWDEGERCFGAEEAVEFGLATEIMKEI